MKAYLKRLRKLAAHSFCRVSAAHKESACGNKVRYSKESATRAAIRMKEKTGDEFDAYECVYCKGWHIGHTTSPSITIVIGRDRACIAREGNDE